MPWNLCIICHCEWIDQSAIKRVYKALTTCHNSERERDRQTDRQWEVRGTREGETDGTFVNWDFNKFRIKPSKYLIWLLCNINSPLELILSWSQLVFYGAFIGRRFFQNETKNETKRRQSSTKIKGKKETSNDFEYTNTLLEICM